VGVVLVGGEEVVARGIDGEIAGSFAQGGLVLDKGESAGGVVDGVDGDAIVAAVPGVEKSASRVNGDLGGGVEVGEFIREGGDGLKFGENSGLGVVVEGSDGGGEFVDDVEAVAVGMDGEMTGAGAGFA
jgi:hypothetical protein